MSFWFTAGSAMEEAMFTVVPRQRVEAECAGGCGEVVIAGVSDNDDVIPACCDGRAVGSRAVAELNLIGVRGSINGHGHGAGGELRNQMLR